jgi:hypothetical protein
MDSTRFLAAAALVTIMYVAAPATYAADLATPLTIDQVTVYPQTAAVVLLWKLPGTPKKTESIHHYYSVRYPSDRALSPDESGG